MAKQPIQIIFENEAFVAVNKPAGMLSIPDRAQSEKSLKEFLIEKYGQIYTVHRLDKDTSGLILFAKNETTHKYFSRLFEDRKIEKYYLGVVLGSPNEEKGLLDFPIMEHPTQKGLMYVNRNGKPSTTGYEVLSASKHFSLVAFQLFTGRTHQIRVHCKNFGHPLACDPLYGDGKPVLISTIKKNYKLSKDQDEETPIIQRLALHSYRMVFEDESGQHHDISSGIPKEYDALMKQIRKHAH